MPKKRTLEEEINKFLEIWGCREIISFLRDIIPLFELYDVEDEDDWVEKKVGGGEENVRTVRLVRTVYLMSRIAEFHAGKLCFINIHFKNLWKKMEKNSIGIDKVDDINSDVALQPEKC